MNLRIILTLLFLYSSVAICQESRTHTAIVTGIVHDNESRNPLSAVQVSLPKLGWVDTTDEKGKFSLENVPIGTYQLCFKGSTVKTDTIKIIVRRNKVDLGTIHLYRPSSTKDEDFFNYPIISLADGDIADGIDGEELGNVSGMLTAGRDPFSTASAFSWNAFRYKGRGYEQNRYEVVINGMPMNELASGRVDWSLWSGLNDVFRNATSAYGLQQAEATYGGIGGSSYIDASASSQRKQTRLTYSLSNRVYGHRIMVTHSSGPLTNGWAYSASISKRWARQGYVPGTHYDGYSFFAAVTKKLGMKHQADLTMFGAPTERGRSSSSYMEAYQLSEDNYYNPTWGMQNGAIRNSKIQKTFQPVFILSHRYSPSARTTWNTAVGHIRGRSSTTLLDWSNAADPRPDYYQNLPRYYLHSDHPDSSTAQEYAEAFKLNSQIDWAGLYHANYMNRTIMPGAGSAISSDSGRLSLYVVGADVVETSKWTFSTNLQHVVNDRMSVAAGLNYITESGRFFRELVDLLGGDFYLNVNSFADRIGSGGASNSNWYYNVNDTDPIVKQGDKYYYDYGLNLQRANVWGLIQLQYKRLDLFVGGRIGKFTVQREGYFRNGVYSMGTESFGLSRKYDFTTYNSKAGLTFKLNGRNYLFINGGISKEAPTVDQTFVSVRLRNKAVEGATLQSALTSEGGYFLRSPSMNLRLVGYITELVNTVQIQRFFYEGTGSANTFVNYVMKRLNKRQLGIEIGGDYKLSSTFTVTAAAHLGQHFFTNNPAVYIYNENSADTIVRRENVYISNYYLGAQPQSTYTGAFKYQSKKYWYASLSANYIDRNYVSIAAPRRSETVAEVVEYGSEDWKTLLHQERLPSAFTLDLFCGKSFLLSRMHRQLPRNTFLYLNIGVNNILNNKSIAVAGFENPRFDYAAGYVNKFAPKYSYAPGRNFFINVALKF